MKMNKKIGIIAGIIALSILATIIYFYVKIYGNNIKKEGVLYIPTHSNFEDLTLLLEPFLKDRNSFYWVAKQKNLVNKVKPGKYKIDKKMSNNSLVNRLRSGKQSAVNVSFNNQDSLEKLAGRISEQIEVDSISLLKAFTDIHFLQKHQFNLKTALAMYIPNSYRFYWNTSATQFRNKMLKEYQRFWNKSRIEKAKKINLTPKEVITLASIVQKETSFIAERPTVAGLYLNRLRKGWALQADPTIIFAIQQKRNTNIPIRRVLIKDLKVDSPYNTYKNTGLPPGLISMPDISSIDAVLNAKKHNYFYMCASTTNIGKHIFAKTLAQHNRNAKKYQAWLNKQRVMR